MEWMGWEEASSRPLQEEDGMKQQYFVTCAASSQNDGGHDPLPPSLLAGSNHDWVPAPATGRDAGVGALTCGV